MKIILLQDVFKLGNKGELKEVSDGYARNFLIPRKFAKEADKQAIQEQQNIKQATEFHHQEDVKHAKEIAEILNNKLINIYVKGGKDGKFFGSVTTKEISEEINKVFNINIDKRKIHLEEEIEALGVYTCKIKFNPEVSVDLRVSVSVPEEDQN